MSQGLTSGDIYAILVKVLAKVGPVDLTREEVNSEELLVLTVENPEEDVMRFLVSEWQGDEEDV